jgi:CRP-like cAMP-binding protein
MSPEEPWGTEFWGVEKGMRDAQSQGIFPLNDEKALRERHLKILGSTPLFHALPRRRRHEIAKMATINHYRNDEIIERIGEPQEAFHIILEGDVYVVPRAGHERVLWSQDYFGDVALLDGAPRTVTLRAAGPVTTASITKFQFEKILRDEPGAATALLPALAVVIRDLLRADIERIPDHSQAGEWREAPAGGAEVGAAQQLTGADAEAWLSLLRNVGIFSALKDKQLRHVARLFTIERFADGTALTVAGAPGDSFHVILEGRARVFTPSGHGRELRANDCFGELSLIDHSIRSGTVIAEGDLVTAMLTGAEFDRMLKQEPAVGFGLATGLVGIIRDLESAVLER